MLDRLKAALGDGGWSQDPARVTPKLTEWRGRWPGSTPLLALPSTLEQTSTVVRLCAQAGVAITPQGGNTGLVGGQIPQGEVLLSTERLRRVRETSPHDDAITVEAGVTLAEVHAAAEAAGRSFPLSLASEGQATVGGLISTNAGGTAVLRYGPMRDLVLGIEAVLPDGTPFSGLKRLRKDVSGYDLKQLLIGAEGTLGVVTAATLKLFPLLTSRAVAVAGADRLDAVLDLLALAKAESGGGVEAFELIGRTGVEIAVRNLPAVRDPLAAPWPWLVLIELASGAPGASEAAMQRLLEGAMAGELIGDAVVAQSDTQARAFWALREGQSAAQRPEGQAWKHDCAVPVSQVPTFVEQASAAARRLAPGCRVVAFGHVGDGNIHFDVLPPTAADGAAHLRRQAEGSREIHDLAVALGGSISAEHGLGRLKSEEALRYKSAAEITAMRAIRQALDPNRIMNPRVLF